MNRSINWIVLGAIAAFLFWACAGGISSQARSQVTFFDSFQQLQQQPEKYRGETVMLGGKIVAVNVEAGATELVVLQLAVDRGTRPTDNDNSQGRFLVRSGQFVDPAIYPQGTLITVVGRIMGSETRDIGQMPYRYPLIDIVEMKKWPAGAGAQPRFHFGFGVGTHF